MGKFNFDAFSKSAPVLDRIIEAYGFGSKIMLAQHFDIALSSLSGRYKRDVLPADMVVQCVVETGVSLEWLDTGNGKMYENQSVDILRVTNYKLIDGEIFLAGDLMVDKVMFGAGLQFHPMQSVCRMAKIITWKIKNTGKFLTGNGWYRLMAGSVSAH
ncbi:helix-turn-helix transcriptional regulator [Proteus mirabilis]|uniref:helix-turn-helix transcriptional regulator n=2 Tax=Proteus mirabilis TaxID=584 RepID=UPI0028929A87|nr:helix-turn-helix transcriptional regulator [Proteus mirabilis]